LLKITQAIGTHEFEILHRVGAEAEASEAEMEIYVLP
jgi:hypothetical protein